MDYKKEIDDLVNLILKEGASDLHLTVGRQPVIRSSGVLIPLVKKPVLTDADMKGFLNALLSPANKEILEKDRDVDFSYSLTHARFRGNAFFHQGIPSVALRLIPKVIRTLTDLNLPPILETFTRKPQGFFLVVGPIGQGKTTTLATL
ncbi:MAG: type IV pili twitching motility protein PilT, partial [Patescibacteria group bacterium]|nr:type IV pili twitching motility protein PilT [Patescibacteria group bacterium]